MKHRSTFHDDPTMTELLRTFTARLAEHVAELRASQAAGDHLNIRRLAHQLKGAGKSYGFEPITTHAANVEHSITQSNSLPPALPELNALINYIEQVEGYTPR